ncbi:hypothetical protein C8F01DRAFT_1365707 [Mycena amicta]|nr:hypothetical protein C8F01DRAFT_1365707 [Mycena amicta]
MPTGKNPQAMGLRILRIFSGRAASTTSFLPCRYLLLSPSLRSSLLRPTIVSKIPKRLRQNHDPLVSVEFRPAVRVARQGSRLQPLSSDYYLDPILRCELIMHIGPIKSGPEHSGEVEDCKPVISHRMDALTSQSIHPDTNIRPPNRNPLCGHSRSSSNWPKHLGTIGGQRRLRPYSKDNVKVIRWPGGYGPAIDLRRGGDVQLVPSDDSERTAASQLDVAGDGDDSARHQVVKLVDNSLNLDTILSSGEPLLYILFGLQLPVASGPLADAVVVAEVTIRQVMERLG